MEYSTQLRHGVCNGRGNSLRAEGAGMRTMNAHKHYHEPFPNETLRSEFDITEQIYNTQSACKIKPIYVWVKGHQDDDKQYDDLSLEAQLNIDADELAGVFQQQSGKSRPIVNMLPSCPALLLIRGISVTSNYRKQLIRASVEPTYIQYLQYKFGWSDEVVLAIAWKSLSLAIPRIKRDVIITKICNDLLPTATTLYKRKYQHHDTCVLCSKKETRDHILRCNEPTRIKWRRKMLSALRSRLLYLETDFSLGETLCTAVAEWIETETVDINKYPEKYHKAIKSQHHIGWRHMFSGKISQEWLRLQEQSTKVTTGHKRLSYVWGASIVEVLLKQFVLLWELRNEEVHGKTAEKQEQIRKTKLSETVRKLNDQREQARPSDMCLFHPDIDEYIEQSNSQAIASYISSHKRAISNSIKQWATASHLGVTSIINWVSGNNSREQIERIHSRQRKSLLHNSRKKDKARLARIRKELDKNQRQTSIAGYYTLNRVSD
jgi:hypothetical protein